MTGPVVVSDDGRRMVRVTGADRRSFLDATLSQAVADLPAGHHREALWLDVHGAPLAALDVAATPADDALLVVTVADAVAAVVEGLGGRTFLADAAFAPSDHRVVAVRGPVDGPAVGEVVDEAGVVLLGRRDGVDVVAAPDDVARWLDARGLPAPDDGAALWDHEVRSGVPRFGHEIVGPHLPEEAGVLPTHVHLAKGCYPGQEAVARMWMLGRPRRHLAVLALDHPARAGDEVGTGRQRVVVTRCTGAAPWAALAFVPSDTVVGTRVDGPGWQGSVAALVGEGLPQPGADPAVTRRRDRADR